MKNQLSIIILLAFTIGLLTLSNCTEKKSDTSQMNVNASSLEKPNYNGFESQLKWGEHLVVITGLPYSAGVIVTWVSAIASRVASVSSVRAEVTTVNLE